MNKHNVILVLLVMAIISVTCAALVNPTMAADKDQMKERTIKGKLVQKETGVIVLKTPWFKTYRLTGMDLSRAVGSKVKVTGTVRKAEGGDIINVLRCETVK